MLYYYYFDLIVEVRGMKRKLVQQGNGAMTITLPYTWAVQNSLKKGDYVDLVESGRDLIISSEAKRVNKAYEINVSNDKPFFKRYLRTCYVLGYDLLAVSTDDILPIASIKEALTQLIGFEIIEQSAKRCVISMVASPFEDNFDTILRRVFFMTESMLKDIISALSQGNFHSLKEIAAMESSINTYVDFCLRILNKKGYINFSKTPYLYHISTSVEQIADALRDFALNSKTKDKKVIGILSQILVYYKSLQEMFFKYDMTKIKKIKEERLNLFKEIRGKATSFPEECLDMYLCVSLLHQFEIALDPINN